MLDRLARRKMHQVDGLAGVACKIDVACDHQALSERRPTAETELLRHRACMGVPAAGQRLLLAVHGDHPPGDRVVLQRPAHDACRRDRPAVVGEGRRAGVGECPQLGELGAVLALRQRSHEADGDLSLLLRARPQAAQRVRIVDHGVGVRDRQDRAVPSRGCSRGARRDRLLVLAPRRAEMDVRVDERRRENRPVRLDDSVLVRVQPLAELGNHAVVDPHIERRIDTLGRIEQSRTADDDVLGAAAAGEHHATPTADSTTTGPVVSKS